MLDYIVLKVEDWKVGRTFVCKCETIPSACDIDIAALLKTKILTITAGTEINNGDNLVIDLDDLDVPDDDVVNTIIGAFNRFKKIGGKIAIVTTSERIQKKFRGLGFNGQISFFPTNKEALEALNTP